MNAKIVYTSLTGNTEEITDIIKDELEKLDVDTEVLTSDEASVDDFEDADICIIASYTYDDGVIPDDFLDFYDDLEDIDLSGKIFGVAGTGDTFYDFYCKAVDDFDKRLEETGATRGAEPVKIELAPDSEEDIQALENFAKSLVEAAE